MFAAKLLPYAAVFAVGLVATVAPAHAAAPVGGPRSDTAQHRTWVDEEVAFDSAGVTVHGTLHRPESGKPVPAALIIAGSGPTDRDGNSPLIPGSVNTLRWVANRLAAAGVATLRYDKLGSGRTGIGRYAQDPTALGADVFTTQARDALARLAASPAVDRSRLSVYGHSEGALFALQLAATPGEHAIGSVGLLEPLSRRYLDVLWRQITELTDRAVSEGTMTRADGDALSASLSAAIDQVRATGTVPSDLPRALRSTLNPGTAKFLQQMDRIDPQDLARRLPAHYPALLTCSDSDVQVSCSDVAHIAAGLNHADPTFVRLTGVSHVLKQDPSRDQAKYGAPLPFSVQAGEAITAFARAR
ncbi:hypothetical protein AXK56_01135 [Tsukamurella pulmonis]|uniref:Uncharacterized protein n=2 Tax=Tsukamurella pulmonis TaxID=47312 RepID=A0A1H1EXY5_9ACTN|nr:hypothetical protein AXK56_01135 [Tsukamurella pulmonis]SDQ93511.1 hypothetical protein SAMN04489765_2410 [Tsukamurella pulmonis]SUP20357.1 Alpha/beta hydrolase family [Tsukamurella pulmonis]